MTDGSASLLPLAGSERAPLEGVTAAAPIDSSQRAELTLVRVVGGTSAVAPLWAALVARLAEATGKRFGLLQPMLYAGISPGADVPGFRGITSGNNGAYSACPGWNACTGLGAPDGTALLERLRG